MTCPKCQGFMQLKRFSDFFLGFYAWNCIQCGEVIDKTITENRLNCKLGLAFSKERFLEQERVRS